MRKVSIVLAAARAATSLFAARNAPWSKEKAWEWYNAQPWMRGCNYMPASAANRVDQWQEMGCEERFAEMETELKLAQSIGFNTMRIITSPCGARSTTASWRASSGCSRSSTSTACA